jgi:hypothetical protein
MYLVQNLHIYDKFLWTEKIISDNTQVLTCHNKFLGDCRLQLTGSVFEKFSMPKLKIPFKNV